MRAEPKRGSPAACLFPAGDLGSFSVWSPADLEQLYKHLWSQLTLSFMSINLNYSTFFMKPETCDLDFFPAFAWMQQRSGMAAALLKRNPADIRYSPEPFRRSKVVKLSPSYQGRTFRSKRRLVEAGMRNAFRAGRARFRPSGAAGSVLINTCGFPTKLRPALNTSDDARALKSD